MIGLTDPSWQGTRWRFTDATNGMEYVGFFVDLIESTAGVSLSPPILKDVAHRERWLAARIPPWIWESYHGETATD